MTRETVADAVQRKLHEHPKGLSDGALARMLDKNHPHINMVCHRLEDQGLIVRDHTPSGIINRILDGTPQPRPACGTPQPPPADDARPTNRKNIYVRDADQEVWDRAEQLASEPISVLVTRLLSNYVEQREMPTERIIVAVNDHDGTVARKAFRGRTLVSNYSADDPAVRGTRFYAAQGAAGGLALWYQHGDGYSGGFQTYDDLSDARGKEWPLDFLSAVSLALSEGYAEEIDL
jgi:hypothetical protein